MRWLWCALWLAAVAVPPAAALASPAATASATDVVRRERLDTPPASPVYCMDDSGAFAPLNAIDFRSLYGAFAAKLGWASRIEKVTQQNGEPYVVAGFANAGPENGGQPSRMVRFFLEPYENGLGLRFADFIEPERPLMYADGDYLCDYVRDVVGTPAAQPLR